MKRKQWCFVFSSHNTLAKMRANLQINRPQLPAILPPFFLSHHKENIETFMSVENLVHHSKCWDRTLVEQRQRQTQCNHIHFCGEIRLCQTVVQMGRPQIVTVKKNGFEKLNSWY